MTTHPLVLKVAVFYNRAHMSLEEQIEKRFGLRAAQCQYLNTPVNDVIAVTAPSGRFALKVYNPQSRTAKEVQWELDLIEHLIQHGAPVARPIRGSSGYVEPFIVDGQERAAALFEWAFGEKPSPAHDTYTLLGRAAAQIHKAADTFTPSSVRDDYDATVLIDEQLQRMEAHLTEAKRWQQAVALGDRLKQLIANPSLDRGICHMDLTLDNVHRDGRTLTVFDFDSAGVCWRAIEPYGVLRVSKGYFKAWLDGYRSVRAFSQGDEKAVAAFGIIGDLRVVAWKLGVARSSRGKPILLASDMLRVVDEWLEWERNNIY
jgi:Ser/Thr protein kinase RdoA (MazF antagonist)